MKHDLVEYRTREVSFVTQCANHCVYYYILFIFIIIIIIINPVLIRFFPRSQRWPHSPHPLRDRFPIFPPSRSICSFFDFEADFLHTLFHLLLPCHFFVLPKMTLRCVFKSKKKTQRSVIFYHPMKMG